MASKRKQPPVASGKKSSSKKGKSGDSDEESSKAAEAKAGSDGSAEEKADSDGSDDDERALWVQCATCTKWRRMPPTVSPADLPQQWYCHMNEHDSTRNTCEDSEEEQQDPLDDEDDEDEAHDDDLRPRRKRLPTDAAACDAARRAFCENLIKQAVLEEAGAKGPGKRGSNGVKAVGSMVWVQCCNQNCGKWRHVWRAPNDAGLDGSRLWFCVMNTFDDRVASCGAPQETALDREFEVQLRPKLVLTGDQPDELPDDDPEPEIILSKKKKGSARPRITGSMSLRGAAAAAAAQSST
jgi:CW-type Zinc Finger